MDNLFKIYFGLHGTHRDLLNIIVHSPEKFSRTLKNNGMVYEIHMFANSFTYDIIDFIVNN